MIQSTICQEDGHFLRNSKLQYYKGGQGKIKEMQPLRLCICTGKQFEDTFENAQLRKAKQMQPV